MELQLDDNTHAEVTNLCQQGDALRTAGDLESAKKKYVAALGLLRGNPLDWEAATWIYVAIGDAHFELSDYDKAFKCFANAVQCPGGLGNPFIHLRLGQIAFELGDLARSADELTRAYMGAGLDIFEEDDPKYLQFLKTKIKL